METEKVTKSESEFESLKGFSIPASEAGKVALKACMREYDFGRIDGLEALKMALTEAQKLHPTPLSWDELFVVLESFAKVLKGLSDKGETE